MLQQFLLHLRIAKRTLEMLPRRKKTIRLLQLDNQPVNGHENLVMLKYKFSNAVYYTIGGQKVMAQQVVMPVLAQGQEISFSVHGITRQNDYMLSLEGSDMVLTRIVQKVKAAEPVRTPQPHYRLTLAHS